MGWVYTAKKVTQGSKVVEVGDEVDVAGRKAKVIFRSKCSVTLVAEDKSSLFTLIMMGDDKLQLESTHDNSTSVYRTELEEFYGIKHYKGELFLRTYEVTHNPVEVGHEVRFKGMQYEVMFISDTDSSIVLKQIVSGDVYLYRGTDVKTDIFIMWEEDDLGSIDDLC